MGATESIFYDDEPSASSFPEQYPPPPIPHTGIGPVGNGPPVVRRAKRRSRTGDGKGSGGGRGGRQDSVKSLHGLVLGLPGSGKRTLLERLKGKDPFEKRVGQDESGHTENTSGGSEAFVRVPYQPPADKRVWDKLQIKVQLPLDGSTKSMDNNQVDFVIILMNPNHDPSLVQTYLKQVISDLVRSREQSGQQRKNSDGSTTINQGHPLCLCFLINFRDLQQSKKHHGIQESEVKQSALNILREYAEKLPSNDQLLLQFGTTSLFNCFGLSTLHHFIYSAYLRGKRAELELQLLHVHEEISRSGEAPRVKYKDFLKLLGASTTSEKKIRDHELHNTRNDPHVQQSEQSNDGANITRRQVVSNAQSAPAQMQHQKQEAQTQPLPYENAKNALEAFLASDDEKEEGVRVASKPMKQDLSSDDEADDDDFFYNEAGERCTVHGGFPRDELLHAAGSQSTTSITLPKPSNEVTESSSVHSDESKNAELDHLSPSSGGRLAAQNRSESTNSVGQDDNRDVPVRPSHEDVDSAKGDRSVPLVSSSVVKESAGANSHDEITSPQSSAFVEQGENSSGNDFKLTNSSDADGEQFDDRQPGSDSHDEIGESPDVDSTEKKDINETSSAPGSVAPSDHNVNEMDDTSGGDGPHFTDKYDERSETSTGSEKLAKTPELTSDFNDDDDDDDDEFFIDNSMQIPSEDSKPNSNTAEDAAATADDDDDDDIGHAVQEQQAVKTSPHPDEEGSSSMGDVPANLADTASHQLSSPATSTEVVINPSLSAAAQAAIAAAQKEAELMLQQSLSNSSKEASRKKKKKDSKEKKKKEKKKSKRRERSDSD